MADTTTIPQSLKGIGTSNGKCFEGTTQKNNCTSDVAASQDLERFRVTTTPAPGQQCTLYVSGSNSTVINILSSLTF